MTSAVAGASGGENGGGTSEKFTNRLAKEKSPYLLQHATNPVNWYPWGEEAFKAAAEQNKLIFLSVGYSTCHWCHVMERESFEDDKVAEIMNRHFINIKVDREERPDVDKVYLTFVTTMSGSGGWPMSVWLTPDLHPIYGGTYYPPNSYYGRPGFTTILQALAQQWTSDEAKIRRSGTAIVSVLQKNSNLPKVEDTTSDAPPHGEVSAKCFAQLARSYEPDYGGFGESPKFPQPCNLNFLFAYYFLHPGLDDAKNGLDMALHTLTMMSRGGIHDHVAQGFARYSTDKSWHVPHFEKMLYDQAQLVHSYLDAYLVTRKQEYADTVMDIIQYVMRDLSHESGGFYSAEDADSLPTADSKDKKEGAFCVWTHQEIHSILSDLSVGEESGSSTSVAELFCHHYSVVKGGNVDPHKDPHDELKNQNILLQHDTIQETAEQFSLSETQVLTSLSAAREKLFQFRLTRPRPHRDEKMITAWNGMMVSAICRAGAVLGDRAYVARGAAAAAFIKQHLICRETGQLYRAAYRGDEGGAQVTLGSHKNPGFCDDYAWTIRGLLSLYEATLDQRHLVDALELQTLQDQLFWDTEDGSGGYYSSQQGDHSILIRMKDDHDGAEPSVNSVSAGNLLRLSRLLDRSELLQKCRTILRVFSDKLRKIPVSLPDMAVVLLMLEEPTSQVILSGDPESAVLQELLGVVHSFPQPNRVLLVAPPSDDAPLYTHLPSLRLYQPKHSTQAQAIEKQSGGTKDSKPEVEDTRSGRKDTQSGASESDSREEALESGKKDLQSGSRDPHSRVQDPPTDSSHVIESARAFVCHNFVCSLPMTKPEQLRKNLEKAFQEAAAVADSN